MAHRLLFIAVILALVPVLVFGQGQQYILKGKVASEDGTPLFEAQITVFDPENKGTILAQTYTDSGGVYDLQFTGDFTTGLEAPPLPLGFALGRAYPNPAEGPNARIRIPYSQPEHLKTAPELQLFDVLGRRVNIHKPLSAGTYFYRLRFVDGTVSAGRRLVFQGGKAEFELMKMAPEKAAAMNKPLLMQTAFPVAVEYPGHYALRQEVLLEPGAENTFDASLKPVVIHAQATIGPEGGTIADTTGRVTLEVPAGALATPTEITIRSAEDTLGNPWLFKGTVIELMPDGLQFSSPATLTLQYDSLAVPPGTRGKAFAIFTLDTLGWQPVDSPAVVIEPGRIRATISHFSRKAAGVRRMPGIQFLIHGYKSNFPQYDQPLGHLEMSINSCRRGECSDTSFTVIKDATDFPQWQPAANVEPFNAFMSECLIDAAPVFFFFDGLTRRLIKAFGNVSWDYGSGVDASHPFGNLQPDRPRFRWSAQFSSSAFCGLVQSAGYNVVLKGISTLYLGDINPAFPEDRRWQLLITNPDEIAFDIHVRYKASVQYDRYDGIIHFAQPTIIFNHGLQTCDRTYDQIQMPYPKVTLKTEPPDRLVVTESDEHVYKNVTAKYASLWLGLLIQSYCQSHFGDDSDTIGYGARLINSSYSDFSLDVQVVPRRRSRR